jgi:hypothetical protein
MICWRAYLDVWMGGAEKAMGRVEGRTIQRGLKDVVSVEHWERVTGEKRTGANQSDSQHYISYRISIDVVFAHCTVLTPAFLDLRC